MKADQIAAVRKRPVADNNAGNIYGKKTAAAQKLGNTERQQNETYAEHRIKPEITNADFFQQNSRQPSQSAAGGKADNKLENKHFGQTGSGKIGVLQPGQRPQRK